MRSCVYVRIRVGSFSVHGVTYGVVLSSYMSVFRLRRCLRSELDIAVSAV